MTASLPEAPARPDAIVREETRDGQERREPAAIQGAGGERPLLRLRSDLTISRQVTAEGVVFVFKDPLLNRFYRFPEEAHFIACQLDGQTDLEVVRKRTEDKFRSAL